MKCPVIIISIFLAAWTRADAATDSATNLYPPVIQRSESGMAPAGDTQNDSLPAVIVNGIDTMRGNPQVAFKVVDESGIRSYVLRRGDEREGIRIEAIDQGAGTVRVNNHGRLQKIGIEHSAVPVSAPPAPVMPSTEATLPPMPEEPVLATRQSQPDVGPGVSVVVIGHRDPPPHINGLIPMDVTPAGGVGRGGVFSTNVNPTNIVNMPNTNASVPFSRPGQLGPAGPRATIPASSARIQPAPPIPGGTGSSSPDVGGSATTGVQGPPLSTKPTTQPPPMPPSPTR